LATDMGCHSGRATPSLHDTPYRNIEETNGRRSTYLLPIAVQTNRATSKFANAAQIAAEKRFSFQQEVTRRIPDLAIDPSRVKLTNKLKEWWNLPDFAAFQKEIKKTLKADIPLKERNEWEAWISETRAEIHALTAEIVGLEAEMNSEVYDLFDLTADEITLLEANI